MEKEAGGASRASPADAEVETHLGLLLPERERLLLVQQPGHDHEAELASKLPVREGAGEAEGVYHPGGGGFKSPGWVQGGAGHTPRREQGRAT